MIFRNLVTVIVVLAATAGLAQSAQPGATPVVKPQTQTEPKGPAGSTPTDPLGVGAMREEVKDKENTVSQMRAVLNRMRAEVAKSKVSDSQTKANIEMWELVVDNLDKERDELHQTLAVRENMEVRRVALYKQADAKIAAATQAARAAQAARFAEAQKNATGSTTPSAEQAVKQSTTQRPAAQIVTEQHSAAQPASSSASPN